MNWVPLVVLAVILAFSNTSPLQLTIASIVCLIAWYRATVLDQNNVKVLSYIAGYLYKKIEEMNN